MVLGLFENLKNLVRNLAAATVTVGWRDMEWDGNNASTTIIPFAMTGIGSFPPLEMLLRRIGREPPQTGTDHGGSGALDSRTMVMWMTTTTGQKVDLAIINQQKGWPSGRGEED
jgi:hypothetical protein